MSVLPAAEIAARMPASPAQDEEALLAAAREVEPTPLEGGYRQYDLTTARVATRGEERDLTLRLVLPPEADHAGPYPVVAYVHGGGFIGGNPRLNVLGDRSISKRLKDLLDEGFAVASLGYRLAREAGWPAPVSDTLCGLRFLHQHGGHWDLDGARIGVTGHSAGARIAGLLALVESNAFHVQDLPWGTGRVPISAAWLWAGSAWDYPQISRWSEYGKPENYSVPRLLIGDHPALNDAARHRLRVRYNVPHLSENPPPLVHLRGKSDYGGDHSDAELATEIWRIAGGEAELVLVPGGHNTGGPREPLIAFFKQHLAEPAEARPRGDSAALAERLLEADHPYAAMEVLNTLHTSDDGTRPPEGEWMYLSDEKMMWLPAAEDWPAAHAALARRARRLLADREDRAGREAEEKGYPYQALVAAENAFRLNPGAEDLQARRREVRARAEEAREDLNRLRDLKEEGRPLEDPPAWASRSGVDAIGPWAEVDVGAEATIRLRRMPAGEADLPEWLWYRNHTKDPWKKRLEVKHTFWLAEQPMTRAQWRAIQGKTPPSPETARHPVNRIDYLQIIDVLAALSEQKNLVARLPSEEEWLWAATREGRLDNLARVDLQAIHALNIDASDPGPLPVDDLLPSRNGLYGILGGVHEWTASPGRHTARFTDEKGRFRVLSYPIARGGAWSSMPQALSPAQREQMRHGNRQPDLGFRLAIGGGPEAANWTRDVVER